MTDGIQDQVTELRIKQEAQEIHLQQLSQQSAINHAAIEAVHTRQDKMSKTLDRVESTMLTEERITSILEHTFNLHVVRVVKMFFAWFFGSVSVILTAWITTVTGFFKGD